ncbi:MAG: DnaA/Hda family protein [Planctomycetota bacterium]
MDGRTGSNGLATKDGDTRMAAELGRHLEGRLGDGPLGWRLGGAAELGVENGRAVLRVSSRLWADVAEKRLVPELAGVFGGDRSKIDVRVESRSTTPGRLEREARRPRSTARADAGGDRARPSSGVRPGSRTRLSGLGARYTFDRFVVGSCNRVAHEAARRLAGDQGAFGLGPVFLYGPCGVGKSHLAHASANAFAAMCPGTRVRVVSGEEFVNQYAQAVRHERVDAFRRTWRSLDLLCVDDVHFVATRKGSQDELLHTLDALALRGCRLMLISDSHPDAIRDFSDRIRSRCVSGALVGIEPPDRGLGVLLLKRWARERGRRLTDEAVDALLDASFGAGARCNGRSARGLEGLLLQTIAMATIERVSPDESIGASIVASALACRSRGHGERDLGAGPTSAEIATAVCEALGVDLASVRSGSRVKRAVVARGCALYVARRATGRSFPELAGDFGRPSHSSVIASCKRVADQIASGEVISCGTRADGQRIEAFVGSMLRRFGV